MGTCVDDKAEMGCVLEDPRGRCDGWFSGEEHRDPRSDPKAGRENDLGGKRAWQGEGGVKARSRCCAVMLTGTVGPVTVRCK